MRMIIRILLTAAAFTFVLPMIHGIDFHGNFGAALVLALAFAVMLWLVDLAAVALSAVLTIGTLGAALLWLIPVWILGSWLLPAVALRLLSDVMPSYLTVTGWMPAIFGGLVMLVIGILTSGATKRRAADA